MTESFVRYRGNGQTADGTSVGTRGEQGKYIASPELAAAVNTALAVEQPLLVTGDAGTGKTVLAYSVAAELGLQEPSVFAVRSDQQGRDLLYSFDNMRRFYDAQVHDPKAADRRNYLEYGVLGQAFGADKECVVLIDEIDKAPRDFPNDLLQALDRMEVSIPEIGTLLKATKRPIVIITSNRESQLPDPFLRRCVFHHIAFPEKAELLRILNERLGHLGIAQALLERAVQKFSEIRDVDGLQKKPATGELLAWVKALNRAVVSADDLNADLAKLPSLGALIKMREDLERMSRQRSPGK
jgi:MoxR-like ATPase